MKAAVLYETNAPLVVVDSVEMPELSPGQVLVKIAFSGVCRSQLMEARGHRGVDRFLPHLLGHEGSGKVVAVGEGVTKVKADDYVILGWIKGEGMDTGGVKYRNGNETINAGAVTTFNDYAVVSENRCVTLPQGIPLDVATLFGCAIPTGSGIILNEINMSEADSMAFWGLGGIGLSALMASQLVNCPCKIAVDPDSSKLALARDFGATHLLNPKEGDPVQKTMEITGNKGVDCSIEAAGLTTTIEQAFQVVKKGGGLCIFASHPESGSKIRLDPHELISGKNIRGTWGGACKPDRDIPRFAQLYLEGKLPLERLLSNRYSLEQINRALEDLEKQKIFRALIEINPTL